MALLLRVFLRWKGKLQWHGRSRHHHASDYSQRCEYLLSNAVAHVPHQISGPCVRYIYTQTNWFVCVAVSSWLDPSSEREARGLNRSGANRERRSKSMTRFRAQKIASSPLLARRTRFRTHSTCYRTGKFSLCGWNLKLQSIYVYHLTFQWIEGDKFVNLVSCKKSKESAVMNYVRSYILLASKQHLLLIWCVLWFRSENINQYNFVLLLPCSALHILGRHD